MSSSGSIYSCLFKFSKTKIGSPENVTHWRGEEGTCLRGRGDFPVPSLLPGAGVPCGAALRLEGEARWVQAGS